MLSVNSLHSVKNAYRIRRSLWFQQTFAWSLYLDSVLKDTGEMAVMGVECMIRSLALLQVGCRLDQHGTAVGSPLSVQ
jgi:hypothetical protein